MGNNNSKIKEQAVYRIGDFSRMIGFDKITIYRYQKRGLLPSRKNPANGYYIFYKSDIDDFKEYITKYNEEKNVQ